MSSPGAPSAAFSSNLASSPLRRLRAQIELVGARETGMLHGSMDTGNVTDRRPPAEVTLQEITRALIEHPAVAEVSVVPCQHPDGGRRQVAFVVPRGAPCPEDELQRHVNERLGSGGKLQKVVFMDALPRSATGKVDRRRLETGEFNDCPPPPA